MEMFAQLAWEKVLFLAPAAALFAVLAMAMKRGAIGDALRRSASETGTNLLLIFLNGVIVLPLLIAPTESWNNTVAVFPALATVWDAAWPPLTLLVTLLVGEFTVYWRHRIEHSRLLWPIHAVHHSDEAMTWLALGRKHPLAFVIVQFVDMVLLLMLGLPVWAIAVCSAARTWWGFFIHADVPWTLGPVGKVLISPAAHRFHHIDDVVLCGANYGGILTVWDKVFGTWVDPEPYIDCTTGVDGGSRGFAGELYRPFAMWRELTDGEGEGSASGGVERPAG